MKMSIVMPVFGKANFTVSALKDLFRLDENEHEIIVVDDFSTDDTGIRVEALQLEHKNLHYIKNDMNRGFAYSCDHGYHHSSGDIVLFLNNDIRAKDKSQWTSSIIDVLDANPNSIVGPTGGLVDPKNGFQFVYETNDATKAFNYVSGWCVAAKREVFDKLIEPDHMGPFSEEFFCYYEDTDMSFRAKELGIELKIVSVPVVHFGKISTKQLNTFDLYNKARNIFIKKWSRIE